MQPRITLPLLAVIALLAVPTGALACEDHMEMDFAYPQDRCGSDADCDGGTCEFTGVTWDGALCDDIDWSSCFEAMACVPHATQPAWPWQECRTHDDCPSNHTCDVSDCAFPEETSCHGWCAPTSEHSPTGACLSDDECPVGQECLLEPVVETSASDEPGAQPYPMEKVIYGRCEVAGCTEDQDCTGLLVCHLEPSPCGTMMDDAMEMAPCVQEPQGSCGPQWLTDACDVDLDCGVGFACVSHSVCADGPGGATTPEPNPGAHGEGIEVCHSVTRCEPLLIGCEESVCPEGLECTELGTTTLDAKEAMGGGEQEGASMETLCLPRDYEAWVDSGIGSPGAPGFLDLPPAAVHVEGSTTPGVSLGGCQGGPGSMPTWMGALLALVILGRRRS